MLPGEYGRYICVGFISMATDQNMRITLTGRMMKSILDNTFSYWCQYKIDMHKSYRASSLNWVSKNSRVKMKIHIIMNHYPSLLSEWTRHVKSVGNTLDLFLLSVPRFEQNWLWYITKNAQHLESIYILWCFYFFGFM